MATYYENQVFHNPETSEEFIVSGGKLVPLAQAKEAREAAPNLVEGKKAELEQTKSVNDDLLATAPSSLKKAAAGIAATPRTLHDVGSNAVESLIENFSPEKAAAWRGMEPAIGSPTWVAGHWPDYQSVLGKMGQVHEPQTTPGQYLDTAIQTTVPAMLGPGRFAALPANASAPARMASALKGVGENAAKGVAAGVASESAGQVLDDTSLGPVARSAGITAGSAFPFRGIGVGNDILGRISRTADIPLTPGNSSFGVAPISRFGKTITQARAPYMTNTGVTNTPIDPDITSILYGPGVRQRPSWQATQISGGRYPAIRQTLLNEAETARGAKDATRAASFDTLRQGVDAEMERALKGTPGSQTTIEKWQRAKAATEPRAPGATDWTNPLTLAQGGLGALAAHYGGWQGGPLEGAIVGLIAGGHATPWLMPHLGPVVKGAANAVGRNIDPRIAARILATQPPQAEQSTDSP